jgi:hypothetical protein
MGDNFLLDNKMSFSFFKKLIRGKPTKSEILTIKALRKSESPVELSPRESESPVELSPRESESPLIETPKLPPFTYSYVDTIYILCKCEECVKFIKLRSMKIGEKRYCCRSCKNRQNTLSKSTTTFFLNFVKILLKIL